MLLVIPLAAPGPGWGGGEEGSGADYTSSEGLARPQSSRAAGCTTRLIWMRVRSLLQTPRRGGRGRRVGSAACSTPAGRRRRRRRPPHHQRPLRHRPGPPHSCSPHAIPSPPLENCKYVHDCPPSSLQPSLNLTPACFPPSLPPPPLATCNLALHTLPAPSPTFPPSPRNTHPSWTTSPSPHSLYTLL